MAVDKWLKSPVCDTGIRGFESRRSPQSILNEFFAKHPVIRNLSRTKPYAPLAQLVVALPL